MTNKPDPVAGDKPVSRFFVGAGGGALAMAGPIISIIAINSPVVATLSAVFLNAAGCYLMDTALDRSVVLSKAFTNNVASKITTVAASALIVGGVAFGMNMAMKSELTSQPPTPAPHVK